VARHPAHDLRVPARELLREPGTRRDIATTIEPAVLGIVDDRTAGPIAIELSAVSSVDSVAIAGTITVPWTSACRRCLVTVDGSSTVAVEEMYRDVVGADDDAYELEGDQIDLVGPIREYVMIELPTDPLCRAECAGLCPVCGADRNVDDCGCDTTVRDERWAVLDQLDLDE
jgi:uncharacterized protein